MRPATAVDIAWPLRHETRRRVAVEPVLQARSCEPRVVIPRRSRFSDTRPRTSLDGTARSPRSVTRNGPPAACRAREGRKEIPEGIGEHLESPATLEYQPESAARPCAPIPDLGSSSSGGVLLPTPRHGEARRRAGYFAGGSSACPPKAARMADNTLFAY